MPSILGRELPEVTDERFMELRATVRPYTIVILKAGPRFEDPTGERSQEIMDIVMSHAKRNVAMHLAGIMPIVCPIRDGSGVAGVSIFAADPDDVREIMEGDPGVQAGVFTYDIHPTGTYPGSVLPG